MQCIHSGVISCRVYVVDCRPAYAVPRILAKAGLTVADIDVIEFHEAFAVSQNIVLRVGSGAVSK